MYFLIIIAIIAVGAVLVIKSEAIYRFIGPIEWAEAHLGTEGGTRLFVKLIGLLIIIGALLWVTGGLQAILRAIFGSFIKNQ